jgi:hypothetical protein
MSTQISEVPVKSRFFSPSFVLALVALFVALGGST